MLLEGEALVMPGFCFIRVVDFMCYMWIEPLHIHIPLDDDVNASAIYSSYPEVNYNTGKEEHFIVTISKRRSVRCV